MTTAPAKPLLTPDELMHYGVLGMKWGQRRKASGSEIIQARRRVQAKQDQIFTNHEKARSSTTRGTADRRKADAKVDAQVDKLRADPDRVIAARMTRGEKALALVLAAPTMGVSLASIATSSAVSRRLEYKQDKGLYNKKK